MPPTHFKPQSSAQDLKARLDFGKPDLTIIDARDRHVYNAERISGAIPVPLHQLPSLIKSILEPERDIYVYGKTDQDTAHAAKKLRNAGFKRVAELKGGIEGWKAIGGPIEGH